jgi:hypothetical protein
LRASAHGISHLTVERVGRRPSAVERLINTGGVELCSRLFRARDLVVGPRRCIDDLSVRDVRVEVARHVHVCDTL